MLHLINQRRRKILQAMKKSNPPSWGFIVFGMMGRFGYGEILDRKKRHR